MSIEKEQMCGIGVAKNRKVLIRDKINLTYEMA